MSHVAELAMIYTERDILETVLRLPRFGVRLERNARMRATMGGQTLDGNNDVMALVAHLQNGEMIGFRQRELTAKERAGMVDESEQGMSSPDRGLIPVGDFFYGGIEKTFGANLSRLNAEYYAELLRRNADGYSTITIKEEKDMVFVEAEIG